MNKQLMRFAAIALTVVAVALAVTHSDAVRSQDLSPVAFPSLVLNYEDSDGQGVVEITNRGPDAAVRGAASVWC